MKPSERIEYKDSDGLSVPLYRLITLEPSWAESRINFSVDLIAELESFLTAVTAERDELKHVLQETDDMGAVIDERNEAEIDTLKQQLSESVDHIGNLEDELDEAKRKLGEPCIKCGWFAGHARDCKIGGTEELPEPPKENSGE